MAGCRNNRGRVNISGRGVTRGGRAYLRRTRARRVRRRRKIQRGGWAPLNVDGWRSSAAGPVGCAWNGGKAGTWPGVFAAAGGDTKGATVSNYFALSPAGAGPAPPGKATRNARFRGFKKRGGGRRAGTKTKKCGVKRRIRGGGLHPLAPQFVANSFWQAGAAMKGLGAAWSGKVMPISADPSVLNQPIDKNYTYLGTPSIDIQKIHLAAGDSVSRM